jgi:hypothetical protein
MKLGNKKDHFNDDGCLLDKYSIVKRIDGMIARFLIEDSTDEELLDVYYLLFDENQLFENETEKFLFENDKKLWLIYKNSKNTLEIGDHLISMDDDMFESGSSLRVLEINKKDNTMLLTTWGQDSDYEDVDPNFYHDDDGYDKPEDIEMPKYILRSTYWFKLLYKLNHTSHK